MIWNTKVCIWNLSEYGECAREKERKKEENNFVPTERRHESKWIKRKKTHASTLSLQASNVYHQTRWLLWFNHIYLNRIRSFVVGRSVVLQLIVHTERNNKKKLAMANSLESIMSSSHNIVHSISHLLLHSIRSILLSALFSGFFHLSCSVS